MKKILCLYILLCFVATSIMGPMPAFAQEFILPAPGQMVALSPAYSPAVLKGIKLDPHNPFRFHFFVDTGNSYSKNVIPAKAGIQEQEQLKEVSTRLIKYFLASLTIPEKDLWVNLSPYEKDRIVPQEFGQTEMGRDLLAEDYILKQITASLIYPESRLGREFWAKVYAQAQARYGTTNIPINTFNKVWIVPDKAVVYENGGTAFVLENHLKVMLEEDYLSLQKHMNINNYVIPAKAGIQNKENLKMDPRFRGDDNAHSLASQIIRQIVIPALTKEVNEGKNFAQLRQVFYSLILATWYKKKIKDSILNKIYSDRNKIDGVNVLAGDKDKIYQEYIKAFKKGVFNYIKDSETPNSVSDTSVGQSVPRKYFSGGVDIAEYLDRALDIEGRSKVSSNLLFNFAQSSRFIDLFGDFAMLQNHYPAPSSSKPRVDKAMSGGIQELQIFLRNHPAIIMPENLMIWLKAKGLKLVYCIPTAGYSKPLIGADGRLVSFESTRYKSGKALYRRIVPISENQRLSASAHQLVNEIIYFQTGKWTIRHLLVVIINHSLNLTELEMLLDFFGYQLHSVDEPYIGKSKVYDGNGDEPKELEYSQLSSLLKRETGLLAFEILDKEQWPKFLEHADLNHRIIIVDTKPVGKYERIMNYLGFASAKIEPRNIGDAREIILRHISRNDLKLRLQWIATAEINKPDVQDKDILVRGFGQFKVRDFLNKFDVSKPLYLEAGFKDEMDEYRTIFIALPFGDNPKKINSAQLSKPADRAMSNLGAKHTVNQTQKKLWELASSIVVVPREETPGLIKGSLPFLAHFANRFALANTEDGIPKSWRKNKIQGIYSKNGEFKPSDGEDVVFIGGDLTNNLINAIRSKANFAFSKKRNVLVVYLIAPLVWVNKMKGKENVVTLQDILDDHHKMEEIFPGNIIEVKEIIKTLFWASAPKFLLSPRYLPATTIMVNLDGHLYLIYRGGNEHRLIIKIIRGDDPRIKDQAMNNKARERSSADGAMNAEVGVENRLVPQQGIRYEEEMSFGLIKYSGSKARIRGLTEFLQRSLKDDMTKQELIDKFFASESYIKEGMPVKENIRDGQALVELASLLRNEFPYKEDYANRAPHELQERIRSLPPLAQAIELKMFFKIGKNLYISPLTKSFKRHFIFELNEQGEVKYAIEFMIPGRDREMFDPQNRYAVAKNINGSFPGQEYSVKIYPPTELPYKNHFLYGRPWMKESIQLLAYDYPHDGMRLANVTPEIVKVWSRESNIPVQELDRRITKGAIECFLSTRLLGYIGFDDIHSENSRVGLIYNHEGKLVDVKVQLVGDFEDYELRNNMTSRFWISKLTGAIAGSLAILLFYVNFHNPIPANIVLAVMGITSAVSFYSADIVDYYSVFLQQEKYKGLYHFSTSPSEMMNQYNEASKRLSQKLSLKFRFIKVVKQSIGAGVVFAGVSVRQHYASKSNKANKAMNVSLKQSPGGIDLNPAQMSIQIKKDGQDFKFDFNGTEIDAAQVTGATFTIRSMTPVTNLPMELGLTSTAV